MPSIQPFRGLRYDPKHVGSLSNVVAPPYDVIGKELQDQLYKAHPANVIRLILNRDEPGDNEANNRYTRAAKFLKNWRSEGVLMAEAHPAVYVYHQVFATAIANSLAADSWPVAGWSASAKGESIRTKKRSPAPRPTACC